MIKLTKNNSDIKNSQLILISTLVSTVLITFYLKPLLFISTEKYDLHTIIIIKNYLLGISFSLILIITIVIQALKKVNLFEKSYKYILTISCFITIYIVIYGVIFPAAKCLFDGRYLIVGSLSPFSIATSISIDLAVFLTIVTLLSKLNIKSIGMKTIYMNIGLAILILYSLMHHDAEMAPTKNKKIINFSTKNNILLVLADGFSSKLASDLLNTENNRSVFNNFIYYKNSITKHPGTWGSIGEIFGGYEFSIEEINKKGYKEKNMAFGTSVNATLNAFNEKNYQSNFLEFNHWFRGPNNNVITNLILVSLVNSMPYTFRNYFYNDAKWRIIPRLSDAISVLIKKFTGFDTADILGNDYKFTEELNSISENFEKSEDYDNNINIIYLSIPHPPFVLNKDCRIQGSSNEYKYQGYYDQGQCALKIISKMIVKLKEIGVYESTTILITSDHGWFWLDGQINENKYLVNNSYEGRLSEDMIGTLFLIKKRNSTNKKISENQQAIFSQDAIYLICEDKELKCPTKFSAKMNKKVKVYTTKIENAWDEKPFVIIDNFRLKGDYRDSTNWVRE